MTKVARDRRLGLPASRKGRGAGGRRGRDAALLQGEILLGQDRPQVAETVFRDLLDNDGYNNDARVGLVRALMAQERYD